MQTDDGGATDVVLLPLTLGGRRPGVRRPLARVGEHTDEVLARARRDDLTDSDPASIRHRPRQETRPCPPPASPAAASSSLPSLFAFGSGAALAADKPLRVILPIGAGSGVDGIVRAVGPSLTKALGGQPVVIENLPGAGGITGTTAIVQAPADGSAIGVVSNNHAVNPSVFKKLPYDSLKDITPISVIGATPFVLVVNPTKLPAKNAKELQALLKAKPGGYNYASSGNGTIIHLAGEMFIDAADVKVLHIPYKGTGPMVADLIGGQVDLGVVALPAVQGHLKSGALRAIGIMGKSRVASMPELPTIAEQGFPDVDVAGWFAVVGPEGSRPRR